MKILNFGSLNIDHVYVKALQIACKAAAICVTRPGAADSIPCRKEVTE